MQLINFKLNTRAVSWDWWPQVNSENPDDTAITANTTAFDVRAADTEAKWPPLSGARKKNEAGRSVRGTSDKRISAVDPVKMAVDVERRPIPYRNRKFHINK